MDNSTRPFIAGAGICCVDYIVTSPQVNWGSTALVTDFTVQGGGLVGTAIVACSRLGADCSLLSLLGDDQIGDQILAELEAEGVPSTHVIRTSGGWSPFSFIHVDQDSGDAFIVDAADTTGAGDTFHYIQTYERL